MVNRLVSVGDDFTLPPAVKVAAANLPTAVQPTTLATTYASKTVVDAIPATYATKAEAGNQTEHMPPLAKISKARTAPFRIFMTGTSISNFGNASMQVIVEHLQSLYGKAASAGMNMGFLGGGWDNTVSNWKKQVYGGPQFHRLVSTATSTDLILPVVGDELAIWASREAGSGQFEIMVDGVSKGLFGPTAGAQAYATAPTLISMGAGSHQVTIKKPATGTAYIERLEARRTNRAGVETIVATLGGSGIWNATTNRPSAAGNVASIPIVGDNGLAAHFNRDDVDLWIIEHIFNDVGVEGNNGVFEYNFNYAVEQARIRAKPILIIIEPGGNQSDLAAYQSRRNFLLSLRVHPHVTVIDWHGAIWPGTQAELLSLYYNGVDFAHPLQQAYDVLNQLLTTALGIPPVSRTLSSAYPDDRARDMSTFYKGVSRAATTDGTAKTYAVPEASALRILHGAFSGSERLPGVQEWAYRDTAATNRASSIQAQINASVTSDAFGKYKDFTNEVHGVNYIATPDTDIYTVTVKTSGVFSFLGGDPIYMVDDAGLKVPYNELSPLRHNLRHVVVGDPMVFTFRITGSTTAAANVFFSGRVYSISIVKSTVAVLV